MFEQFDAIRFRKLFKKHTAENYKGYLLACLVLFGILAVLYLFFGIGANQQSLGLRLTAFSILYILSGCIFTSSIFSNYSGKSKAMYSLTLPGSHLEKFLIGWVYTLFIFSIVYVAVFVLADYFFMLFHPAKEPQSLLDVTAIYFKKEMFITYIFLHSIMMYGALRFQEIQFFKTSAIVLIVFLVLISTHSWFLSKLISDEVLFIMPMSNNLAVKQNGVTVFHSILLEDYERFIYSVILPILFAITTSAAAFYTLKEKEI